MIPRQKSQLVRARLDQFPAVALLGPRQVGKTTLAELVAEERPSVYLDLEDPADREKLADAALFGELLQPAWTGAHVLYARDRMVLAHTDGSEGADEIGPDNWVQVATRPGVDVGMADPDLAPVGYRALMVLRLADLHYPGTAVEERVRAHIGRRNLRPDVAELLPPLQAGALDYAFLYAAAAKAADGWRRTPVEERAACLERAADLMEQEMAALMALAVREGGKTLNDALAEVREAIDFCR